MHCFSTGRSSTCRGKTALILAAIDGHEDVVDTFLKKLRAGEFTGRKPAKKQYSDMFPPIGDGHVLASYVMGLTQVIGHLAGGDPQDLSG